MIFVLDFSVDWFFFCFIIWSTKYLASELAAVLNDSMNQMKAADLSVSQDVDAHQRTDFRFQDGPVDQVWQACRRLSSMNSFH